VSGAKPATLYHVSPAGRRKAILREGLSPAAEPSYPELERRGVYLWPERDSAWLWTGEQPGEKDVWAVDVSGLEALPDPAIQGACYVPHGIPPARLELLHRSVRRDPH